MRNFNYRVENSFFAYCISHNHTKPYTYLQNSNSAGVVVIFVYTPFIPFTPPVPRANESARMTPCSLGSRPYQDKIRCDMVKKKDRMQLSKTQNLCHCHHNWNTGKEMKLTKHIVFSLCCCCWCWSVIIVAKANPISLSKLYRKPIDISTMYVRCL
jgi:hypothetical protein